MKTLYTIVSITLFSIVTINADAQNYNNHYREENRRINQGVRNGELTRNETYRLYAQEKNIRNEAYRYQHNDGHIEPRERADLKRDNRNFSRNIYYQKHDWQKRF